MEKNSTEIDLLYKNIIFQFISCIKHLEDKIINNKHPEVYYFISFQSKIGNRILGFL